MLHSITSLRLVSQKTFAPSAFKRNTDLKDWVLAVKNVDEKLRDDHKQSHDIYLEEAAWNNKHAALASNSCNANITSKAAAAPVGVKNYHHLLDEECALLKKYNGCFKCYYYNQDHGAKDNICDFPDGHTYKMITAQQDAAGNPQGTRAVAAITTATEEADVTDDEGNFAAAVMQSAALGDGSFSESDGAHMVLIHPEVIKELCLECFALKKPKEVSVTINNGKTKKNMLLTHYVKLSVTSLDNAWMSKTVYAIIAPRLLSGYNLLHPQPVSPPPLTK
ncbi:hypothetical protein CPB84DRAFT_1840544 [Gymnopilus junonius]|uniref:Uncharacterized protein n=1 Tax=Gymnopilus junonius TaxID=109634 RepID=A0A9P5TUV0_GYMJU|nr:hypothetical protein CPB84DRAFT_1840544 [Gymnopilus junonius]